MQILLWCHSVLAAHSGLRINQSVIDDIDRKMAKTYIFHSIFTALLLHLSAQGWVLWEIIMLIKQVQVTLQQ